MNTQTLFKKKATKKYRAFIAVTDNIRLIDTISLN
jgi:hypothetical protein